MITSYVIHYEALMESKTKALHTLIKKLQYFACYNEYDVQALFQLLLSSRVLSACTRSSNDRNGFSHRFEYIASHHRTVQY